MLPQGSSFRGQYCTDNQNTNSYGTVRYGTNDETTNGVTDRKISETRYFKYVVGTCQAISEHFSSNSRPNVEEIISLVPLEIRQHNISAATSSHQTKRNGVNSNVLNLFESYVYLKISAF